MATEERTAADREYDDRMLGYWPELVACALCGRAPRYGWKPHGVFHVVCPHCGSKTFWYSLPAHAAYRWNKRHGGRKCELALKIKEHAMKLRGEIDG